MGVAMRRQQLWKRRSWQHETTFFLLSAFSTRGGYIVLTRENDPGLVGPLIPQVRGDGRVVC